MDGGHKQVERALGGDVIGCVDLPSSSSLGGAFVDSETQTQQSHSFTATAAHTTHAHSPVSTNSGSA